MTTRTSVAAFVVGVVALGVSAACLEWLLGIAYGREATNFSAGAVVFVAVYAVRGCYGWSKVVPLALGLPGLKLKMVMFEGAIALVALWLTLHLGVANAACSVLDVAYALAGCSLLAGALWATILFRATRQVPTDQP